jgi:2-oxoisovalerate dehydrogenase E2 component (dihydrolipoyl transacylase)
MSGPGPRAAVSPGVSTPFLLTDIGEGIAEVEILKWFKVRLAFFPLVMLKLSQREGDNVAEFEDVCEVQSDKATVTITSPFEGRITKVHYAAGEIAKTGSPLIDVLVTPGEGEAAPAASVAAVAAPTAHAAAVTTTVAHHSSTGKVRASPAVRRLARMHNLDLGSVAASGRDGRVLKGDVLQHNAGQTAAASHEPPPSAATATAPVATAPAPAIAAAAAAARPSLAPPLPAPTPLQDRRETLRGVRKAMVKSMTPAASVPWFGYSDEIEMDGLMAARALLRKSVEERGLKLTYMPFLLKATATALLDFGVLNSSLSADLSELIYRGAVNLGVAMDTPAGLVVPNIKGVASRSVLDIAAELARLQALAAAGKLGPDDLSGGTFTLSNIGNIGGTNLSPVPMPGEVAIGAIGRIRKLPRFDERGAVVARHVMEVSWRADHRVVDGATLARFSETWRGYVEQPLKMLVKLQ